MARRVEAKPKMEDENATKSEEAESELPAVPTFAQAEPESILNSSAADIEALGEEGRRRVREECGVELEWEIERIGVPAARSGA